MYTVNDVMTRDVVTLSEDDDLALAENIMHFGRFRHLPVMRRGRLVGLISHRDFLTALAERGAQQARTLPARDVMTRDVETVKPATPLRLALRLMLRKKYGCVPVVSDDGELKGILTEADATRFAARMIADLEAVEKAVAEAAGL